MKARIWLVVDAHGIDRMLKNPPASLSRGEKSVCVDVTVDDKVFQPAPPLLAQVHLASTEFSDANVVLDPVQGSSSNNGDKAQNTLNIMAAKLFERAINSNDDDLVSFAIDALATCKEAGVIVKVVIPEPPTVEDSVE